MTTPPLFRRSVLAAAIAMTGCAALPGGPAPTPTAASREAAPPRAAAPRIVPHEAVRHAAASPDALYESGKQRLARGDVRGALADFDRALGLDAAHADARNGRATAMANLGDVDGAIAELRAVSEAHPGAAHVHNNLGYLLLGEGRLEEAAAALRRALTADPAHARARSNWAQLVRRAPADARWATLSTPTATDATRVPGVAPATATEVVAGPVVQLEWPAPVAPQPVSSQVAPALAVAMPASAPATPALATVASPVVVEAVARPRTPERNRFPSAPPAARAALPPVAAPVPSAPPPSAVVASPPTLASPAPVRVPSPPAAPPAIEVANGAGVGGLARRTALALRDAGQPVARFGNHRDFMQATTTVRYRDGRRAEALALAKRLGLPETAAVRVDDLPAGVDARLVLGRDVAAGIALDRPLRADYVAPLREQAAALQALLDATFV